MQFHINKFCNFVENMEVKTGLGVDRGRRGKPLWSPQNFLCPFFLNPSYAPDRSVYLRKI